MKVYKFFDALINILLILLYLVFAFIVSCMFEIFPWYDSDGGYMLYLLGVWLPLCFVTIIQILLSFIVKHFNKKLAALGSLNAVYIPLIFLLGFANITLGTVRFIGVVAVITMIIYSVLSFRRLKKLK